MGEASGHIGEDFPSLSLVRKDCLVGGEGRGGGGSYPRGELKPLPKVKDLLSQRGSSGPCEEAQTLSPRIPPYPCPQE